jgi:hypothetical protein
MSEVAKRSQTLSCSSGGKREMNLLIVAGQFWVWRVEKTRCHVSDSSRAASAVSASRISHTRIISGSSRIAHLIAALNDLLSCQIFLCEIVHNFGS